MNVGPPIHFPRTILDWCDLTSREKAAVYFFCAWSLWLDHSGDDSWLWGHVRAMLLEALEYAGLRR